MKSERRTAYHHGDLRRVLVETAIELLDERGPDGFSLREVARRASVAAAAPSHHFTNVSGVMTAVAIESFNQLVERFEASLKTKGAPVDRLAALCLSYIDHHEENPGMAAVMFRWDVLDADNNELISIRQQARDKLRQGVADAMSKTATDTQKENATVALWTATHGLVALRLHDRKDLKPYVMAYVGAITRGM